MRLRRAFARVLRGMADRVERGLLPPGEWVNGNYWVGSRAGSPVRSAGEVTFIGSTAGVRRPFGE